MSSGRDRVLQALAHLPGPRADRLALVAEPAVAGLDHLGRRDVHAALVQVGVGQDVALVEQALERLLGGHVAQVVQHLVPETGVEQVQHGVLDAADVEVHAAVAGRGAGRHHPVPLDFRVHQPLVVDRVQVAQVVPAGAGPLRHGVELAPVPPRAVAEVELDLRPVGGPGQRRDRVAGLVLVRLGPEVGHLRQLDRQQFFRQRDRQPVGVVDDRERLAPVALPGEQPVAQPVGPLVVARSAALPASGWRPRSRRPCPGRSSPARARSGPGSRGRRRTPPATRRAACPG